MIGVATPDKQLDKTFSALDKQAKGIIKDSENALSIFQITVDDLKAKNSTMKKQVKLIQDYQRKFGEMETSLQAKINENKGIIDKIIEFFLPKKEEAKEGKTK